MYKVSGLQPSDDGKTVVVIEGVRYRPPLASRSLAALLGTDIGVWIQSLKLGSEGYDSYGGFGNYSLNIIPRGQKPGSGSNMRAAVRSQMKEQLEWLQSQIDDFGNEGLDLSKLVAEARSLEESLRYFW